MVSVLYMLGMDFPVFRCFEPLWSKRAWERRCQTFRCQVGLASFLEVDCFARFDFYGRISNRAKRPMLRGYGTSVKQCLSRGKTGCFGSEHSHDLINHIGFSNRAKFDGGRRMMPLSDTLDYPNRILESAMRKRRINGNSELWVRNAYRFRCRYGYSERGEISPAMEVVIHLPKSAASTPCDSRNMTFAYVASNVMSPEPMAPARAIASLTS